MYSRGSKMEVCNDCLRSCLSLHKNKLDPFPRVYSFFKVMFDKHYSEFLIVPPKFVKKVRDLQGKSTYLEDSTGQKWIVGLSFVNGSFAIQQGWPEFSKDHAIEMGDFLVFHYIKGSHFVVQMYDKSGCEKPIVFNGKDNRNKKTKLNKKPKLAKGSGSKTPGNFSYEESPVRESLDSYMDPVVPDVDNIHSNAVVGYVENPPEISVNDSMMEGETNKQLTVVENVENPPEISVNDSMMEIETNKQLTVVKNVENPPEIRVNDSMMEGKTDKQPTVEPARDYLLKSSLMSDSNAGLPREDDRRADLLDLSVFKKPEKKSDAVNKSLQKTQTEAASPDVVDLDMDEDTSKTSEAELSRNETVSLPPDNAVSRANKPLRVLVPLKPVTLPYTPEFSTSAASSQTPGNSLKIIKQDPKSGGIASDNAVAGNRPQYRAILSINKDHIVKNNGLGYLSTSMTECKGQRGVIVRSLQALKLCESSSASDNRITCLVKDNNESILELPRPLPVKASNKGEVSPEHTLVLLRDPVRRLWPVLHHQRKNCNALAYGWKEFRQSNSIRPGDRCTFVVENIDEGIFQVHISSQASTSQASTSQAPVIQLG